VRGAGEVAIHKNNTIAIPTANGADVSKYETEEFFFSFFFL
jgi:hypothetical protein